MVMGFGGIRIIFMGLIWSALILGDVLLVKRFFFAGMANQMGLVSPHQPSPRQILDQRYARCEISKQVFE